MKLSEIKPFNNVQFVFEQSDKLTDLKQKITFLSRSINEHIIKILIFEDQAQFHWQKELNGFISRLNRKSLKPNGRKPPAKLFFTELFESDYGQGIDVLELQVKEIIDEYKNIKRKHISIEELHNKIKEVHTQLSKDLSDWTYTTPEKYFK